MGRPYTAVIVDDQREFIRAACELFEKTPFLVVGSATRLAEAMDLVCRVSPDVAIVDVHLAGRTGFELTARLRATHPNVRVVLTSSTADASYDSLARAAGAVGFIAKGQLSAPTLQSMLVRRG